MDRASGYEPEGCEFESRRGYVSKPTNEYRRQWYDKNKEAEKSRLKIRRDRVRANHRALIRKMKEETPCADCGVNYPYYVMDFDHVRGTKRMNVSELVTRAVSDKVLHEELDKCEIVCSNCHRTRTHLRNPGSSNW